MEKEFIPYIEALALKELGFDSDVFKSYDTSVVNLDGQFLLDYHYNVKSVNEVKAPLYQQAFRWFREKYQKNIVIFSDGYQWTFDLRWVDEDSLDKYPTIQFPKREIGREWFDTYEEAELECLKKLIEIVKNK